MFESNKVSPKTDLTSWTQERLSELYTAPNDDAFHHAFERAFAPDGRVFVSVNGEDITRDQFKETIRSMRRPMTRADVKFEYLITDSGTEGERGGSLVAGTVKGSWTVVRSLKIRLRAAPAQMQRAIKFEARIEHNPEFTSDEGEDADLRRIVHLTETVEDTHVPVNLHRTAHGPFVPETES